MRLAAIALALAALAAATAGAKPPAGPDGAAAAALYRLQGVGACVAAHTAGRNYEADDAHILADCRCAVDRFIAGRDVATLPRLVPGQDKGLLDEPFGQCRAERRGTAAPNDGRAEPGRAEADRAEAVGPDAEPGGAAPAADERKSPAFDPLAWFAGLRLPSWAWGAIPALAILLFLTMRRRRRSGDLLGPPPSMRSSARPPPRSTWPIDEP